MLLGARNLIVGKNASGKTRVLNVINSLSENLAGRMPPGLSSDYDVTFDDDGKTLRYQMKYEQEQVVLEKFTVDGVVLLERAADGAGHIFAKEIDGGTQIRFQTPPSQLAAVAQTRRHSA